MSLKERRTKVDAVCQACGAAFLAEAAEVKRGKGRFCSKSCAAKAASRPNQAAERNPNWAGGVASYARKRRYKESHPERHAAHALVVKALRAGTLVKAPCEVCGSTKVEGHHDDYSKPLVVRWLCRAHHLAHHAEQS